MNRSRMSESAYGELLRLAAALSLATGVVHLLVSPEHLAEWWGYGFFFMLAGLIQIAYGLVLFLLPWLVDDTGAFFRGALPAIRPVFSLAAVGNGMIVALWLVTRTLGIPAGPQAGVLQPVDPVSVAVTVTELALVAILIRLARRSVAEVAVS